MSNIFKNLEPAILWDNFYQITQTPRPSKKEDKMVLLLKDKAKKNNWQCKQDLAGNVYIYVPASKGLETSDTIIIQNHMDMVCDKHPQIKHDFDTDPIPLIIENGWVKTKGTTLGADNGIGIAFALALAEDSSVIHPKLELFFTVDEETGLHGAQNFDPALLSGKKLLNIDTEEWGSIYIGCAGGEDVHFSKNFETTHHEVNLKIEVSGLAGGHSGIDIHRGRHSAIKIINYLLSSFHEVNKIKLSNLTGGKAHNIIPRNASAKLFVDDIKQFKTFCLNEIEQIKEFSNGEDNNLKIDFCEINEKDKTVSNNQLTQFFNQITLCPHGFHKIDWRFKEELVSQSSNLAKVSLRNGKLEGEISFRFNNEIERKFFKQTLSSYMAETKTKYSTEGYYPSWAPSIESNNFLEKAKSVFKKQFNKEVEIKAIHAGLECGLIKEKLGNIDIISIGPTITGAHSPSESLEIESTTKLWSFFIKLLNDI